MYIRSKEKLKECLEVESSKYGKKSIRCPIFCIKESDILYKFNFLLRKTEYYTNCNKKIRSAVYKYRLKKYSFKTLIQIPINTCDVGLKLIHLEPRIINSKCKIGKNLVMHVNTSIVAKGTGKDEVPVIGDNVVMGINSVILGNVTIGDNMAIGANTLVNKSFEDGNATLAGIPAKIVSKNTRFDWNKKK